MPGVDVVCKIAYNTPMDKYKTEQVITALGGKEATLEFFDIKRQALPQWGEYIPPLRAYELNHRRPDLTDAIKHGK